MKVVAYNRLVKIMAETLPDGSVPLRYNFHAHAIHGRQVQQSIIFLLGRETTF